jgi:GNAT superfamily N-acetyltransferase
MTPIIRVATPADEPFLLGLMDRLADFPIPAWRTARQIRRADYAILLQALTRPTESSLIMVAEAPEGTPVGGVFVSTRNDYFTGLPHAHVEVLAVLPDQVGKGVGRALLDAAGEWARRRGYAQITLNVFAGNETARRLYQKAGYEPETIHYRKTLTPDA